MCLFDCCSDGSIKPEEDDEEAKRRMNDEMRGLMCGTSLDNPYDLDGDDTVSEKDSFTVFQIPSSSSGKKEPIGPSVSIVTCKICTTQHPSPVPMCCKSCNSVLEPERFEGRTWICQSSECQGIGVQYVNPVDAGRCGLCGARPMG